MQKYLAGEIDRAGLADEVTKYWATAEVGAH
jgi:raffinose/stachyose/melibiose transport system substrate-binding protein